MHKIILLLSFGILLACQPSRQAQEVPSEAPKEPGKIYNFMGEVLLPKEMDPAVADKYEKNLSDALANYQTHPDSLDLIIWYGRRLAYTGKYLEAIQVYADGMKLFPDSYRLRRHRGHRFISTRQLDRAVDDFEEAASLSEEAENQVEPDGIPNRLNQPLSNDKFNIWYHLGLAYYLNGRFDKALSSYIQCQEYSDNNDLKVATTYWQYLTYQKLGNSELADALISGFNTGIVLIENKAYLDLLKLYKGENDAEKLLEEASNENGLLNPTLAYGIGNYYQHKNEFDRANGIFLRVLETSSFNIIGSGNI